jgi:hypothetical protein
MGFMKAMSLFVLATLAAAPVLAGEAVSHQQLGLRLSVPDGFGRAPDRVQGKVVFAFQRPPAGDETVGTFIVVSRLGGVLGREKIDPGELAARSPKTTIESEKWKGFDIEVFRLPQEAGEVKLITFNAQVPLKPEAVQIAVTGAASREEELRGVLRAVLEKLEGQTNWLTPAERITRFIEGIAQLVVTVGVFVVIAVVVWRAARKRKTRKIGDAL